MRSLISLLTAVFLLAAPATLPAEPAAGVPELQPLRRIAGEWDIELTVKSGANLEQEQKITGTARGEWILEGRFLQQSVELRPAESFPGSQHRTLFTYDSAKQMYRNWLFHSSGGVSESSGRWSPEDSTFHWTSQVAGTPLTTTATASYPEEGVEEWSITVKNAEGGTVLEISGRNTRRKP